MSKLIAREAITCKIEVTYGTDSGPTEAADAVKIENLVESNAGLRMTPRPSIRGSLAAERHIFGGRLKQLSFSCELKGSGAAGTPPEIGPLLRICGLGETVVVATSVTYAPVSTAIESATIYYTKDGTRKRLVGCRGTVAFVGEVGQPFKAKFTITGHLTAGDPTDVAFVVPTLSTVVPAAFVNGSFTANGFSAVIGNLSFDLANAIAFPPSVNGADGYGEIQITGRDVNGSFNPEEELVATFDPENDLEQGTEFAIATGTIGATAGNIYAISFPAAYYRDIADENRDGIRANTLPFGAVESAGDDEVSIAFT